VPVGRMSEPLAISDDTANIYDGYGPQMIDIELASKVSPSRTLKRSSVGLEMAVNSKVCPKGIRYFYICSW
jgi:hypothetical protein